MVFDFLKKKKVKKALLSEPLPKEEVKTEVLKKEEPKKKPSVVSVSKAFPTFPILLSPHVTEKATQLVADNQYVFKIFPRANKTEVKKAIESLYKVKVISVKIINVSGKTKRLGKNQGWKKGYKKAIIKLAPGQRIEAFTV
ncbi:50S ribosomal protein L23 [Patescibacteria group bacterium]|nr:50S ribosomal protein L23 [Patescibacteria group bacterium]MBU4466762.1 50S ribosomal protein L23 [Patescibacteria group bacterium]